MDKTFRKVKLAFAIPLWNHHMGPVCIELARLLGEDNFRLLLLLTKKEPGYKAMTEAGWDLLPPRESWVVGYPECAQDILEGTYSKIIKNAEVLVVPTGYFSLPAVKERIANGKLTFAIGERLFKEPISWRKIFNPRWIKNCIKTRYLLSPKNVHYLTMGHWCEEDLTAIRACKGRIWRFGYWTDIPAVCPQREPLSNRRIRVGWAGRMLDWKQPDLVVLALSQLTDSERESLELTFVGNGPFLQDLKHLVHEKKLEQCIKFLPSMASDNVLDFMRNQDIYVFSSGRGEGWGAVLNEAMGQGCAIIANVDAGSTLELIEPEISGFTFSGRDFKSIGSYLRYFIRNPVRIHEMGRAAWQRIREFTPNAGAIYLIKLIDNVKHSA